MFADSVSRWVLRALALALSVHSRARRVPGAPPLRMLPLATSRGLGLLRRASLAFHSRAHSPRSARAPPRPRAMAGGAAPGDDRAAYPEEQKVAVGGAFYRRCAAALVFNADGLVLVGERSDRPGSWGMPQGGIEVGESAREAATRELFEEVGVRVGESPASLAFVAELPVSDAFCYPAGGWLAECGLAGQRLEFTLFHVPEFREDPTGMCDLMGNGGEPAEFSRVRWATMDEVVDAVWESKRGPYERCRELAMPIIEAHLRGEEGGR